MQKPPPFSSRTSVVLKCIDLNPRFTTHSMHVAFSDLTLKQFHGPHAGITSKPRIQTATYMSPFVPYPQKWQPRSSSPDNAYTGLSVLNLQSKNQTLENRSSIDLIFKEILALLCQINHKPFHHIPIISQKRVLFTDFFNGFWCFIRIFKIILFQYPF